MPNIHNAQSIIQKITTQETSTEDRNILIQAFNEIEGIIDLNEFSDVETIQNECYFLSKHNLLPFQHKIAALLLYTQTINIQAQWDHLEKRKVLHECFSNFYVGYFFPQNHFHSQLTPIYLNSIFCNIIKHNLPMMFDFKNQLIRVYVMLAYRFNEMLVSNQCEKEVIVKALNIFLKSLKTLIDKSAPEDRFKRILSLGNLGCLTLFCQIQHSELLENLLRVLVLLKTYDYNHLRSFCAFYPSNLLNFQPLESDNQMCEYIIDMHIALMDMQLSSLKHLHVFKSLNLLLSNQKLAIYFIETHDIFPLFFRATTPPRIVNSNRCFMFDRGELAEKYVNNIELHTFINAVHANPIYEICEALTLMLQYCSARFKMEQLYALLCIRTIIKYCDNNDNTLFDYDIKNTIENFITNSINDERKALAQEIANIIEEKSLNLEPALDPEHIDLFEVV